MEVPAAVADGNTIWSEWRAYGMSRGGAPMEIRGVIIFGVQDDQVAWSRMYLEPVEHDGSTLSELMGAAPRP